MKTLALARALNHILILPRPVLLRQDMNNLNVSRAGCGVVQVADACPMDHICDLPC